jgi:hypothetical protein
MAAFSTIQGKIVRRTKDWQMPEIRINSTKTLLGITVLWRANCSLPKSHFRIRLIAVKCRREQLIAFFLNPINL